jgi:hypothetical protein
VVVGLFVVVVSSVVVVLVCANANGAASPQTKAMIVFFTLMPPSYWFIPKFVTQGLNGRSLPLLSLQPLGNPVTRTICDLCD